MSRIKLGKISFSETASPKGLLHLCYSTPTLHSSSKSPTSIYWHFKFHSMNPFVKCIHPLSPCNQKMSFSPSAIVAATWAEVGLRKRELSRLGLFRRNTKKPLPLPPSSWHVLPIKPPVHHPQSSYNSITWHIPLKLRRCEAPSRN